MHRYSRPAKAGTSVLHCFFFAVYPILFFFSYNKTQLHLSVLFLPIAIASIVSIISYLVLKFITKSAHKTGLIISSFYLLFFTYGHIAQYLKLSFSLGSLTVGPNKLLSMIWIIILTVLGYLIMKTDRNLSGLTVILNAVSILMVALLLLDIGYYELDRLMKNSVYTSANSTEHKKQETEGIPKETSSDKPDIYYIIMDSYARSDVLQNSFSFDNHEFDEYLRSKGFVMARKSKANYQITELSIASSLNMRYLDDFNEYKLASDPRHDLLCEMIDNNDAAKFLRSKNYSIINISSGVGATDKNRYADVQIDNRGFGEFESKLMNTTPLMIPQIRRFLTGDKEASRVLDAFDSLTDTQAIRGPKFVFAHIVCPHPPYLFDENGESIRDINWGAGSKDKAQKDIDSYKDVESYLGQLAFINKKLISLMEELLSGPRSPVIILQSDHGPAFYENDAHQSPSGWPTESNLEERMSILNAYYFPPSSLLDNKRDMSVWSTISPVNSLRAVFNFYFNADYEILEDRCYYFDVKHPEFVDVTPSLMQND